MTAVRVDGPRVVDLDDPRAGDVAVAGAKGAGLARARAAGLPVLDGFVLAPAASVAALAAGKELLGSRGSGAARMAVIGWSLDHRLLDDIAAAAGELTPPLIVRSSSVLEGQGEWAGAFTTVPEVRRDEVPKAARSVWATCFALDVLDRCEAAGIEAGHAPMGVLVQPEIVPDHGGAAAIDAREAVTVTAVKGSPRDLMAGWAPGVRAVHEDGVLAGDEAIELMGRDLLLQVVDLARRVRAELGHDRIEWATRDGQVVLLQVQSSPATGSPAAGVGEPVVIPAALAHPYARDLARMTHRYPGALGEELVLGWLPGMPEPVEPRPVATGGAGAGAEEPGVDALRARARRLAAQLTAQAWGEPRERAQAHARLVLRRLRSDRPNESIEALRDLRPVDPGTAATVLGLYEHLAATTRPRGRRGMDRWEPLLAGVAALQGDAFTGQGSVGGIGAGRLVWVESPTRTGHVRPRDIVVAQYPLTNFSPLLWDAAGVVTLGGAPGAHLFEVARSLTVPAVVDCAVGEVVRAGPVLGMVDGDAGRVAVLR